MKRVLKFLKWTGITLGTLLALFIGINAFDETLDPGAAAILNAPPKVKAEDNAYFYLAGLHTAASNNPSEAGRRCVLAQFQLAQTRKTLNDVSAIPECREQDALKLVENKAINCDWRVTPCLKQYVEKRTEIEGLAEQNKVVLERYGQLLEFQQFEDAYYLHPFFIFLRSPPSKLYQAISAAEFQAGGSLVFIHRTATEMEFYRMVLRGETSLLYRMIGIAWLERSVRMVSGAVQSDPDIAQQNQAALLQISRPFSLPERSLGRAIEGEFRFSTAMFRSIPIEDASFLDRSLYHLAFKQNASINYYFRNISVWRDLSQLPAEQYLAAESAALEKLYNPWGGGYLHWVYNPIGKALVEIANPAYADYPRRIIDADGLLRLVSLQIQISAQKIPEFDIPAFLKNADPQFRDPYTGQPMQWDKSRGLYFRGYSDRVPDKDGFISVKL